MDYCPTELLLKIFSFACTDGGRTGCTLSLVSRQIHAVVAPIRFQTVSLTNLPRMRLFLSMIEAMPNPPRVSHLFLFDNGILERKSFGYRPQIVCASVVSTLSASLISLVADLKYVGITSAALLQCKSGLPLLEDLSIACASGHMSISEMPPPALPSMPNLRRFHIFTNASDIEEINSILCVSPQITHIRLSNLGEAVWLIQSLEAALQQESETLHLPVGLKQLIMQPSFPYGFGGWCGTTRIRYADVLEGLRDLEATHKVVVPTPECNYHVEDAKEDWLDNMDGGDGCWRVPPRKTTSTVLDEIFIAKQRQNAARADGEDLDNTAYLFD